METLQTGQAQTAYLRWGDTVRIDLKGRDGGSRWACWSSGAGAGSGLKHPGQRGKSL